MILRFKHFRSTLRLLFVLFRTFPNFRVIWLLLQLSQDAKCMQVCQKKCTNLQH